MQTLIRLLALAAVSATAAATAHANYANINVVDNSVADWADIPDIVVDPVGDTSSTIDIASVKIANDDTYLYLLVTFHAAVNPNIGPSLSLSIDTDNNLATGFNTYSLGQVGAEVSFQNDFPFQNAIGVYNTGVQGVATTGTLNTFDSGAGIGRYGIVTSFQEYRISLAATYTTSEGTFSVFPNETIRLMFWTDAGDPPVADVTSGFTYTFATIPEPSSFAWIAGLGGLGLAAVRRRR